MIFLVECHASGSTRVFKTTDIRSSKKYRVDGIQGDDRLPAMPAEGGYDAYSVSLYKKEHHDSLPPTNEKTLHLFNGNQINLVHLENQFMK